MTFVKGHRNLPGGGHEMWPCKHANEGTPQKGAGSDQPHSLRFPPPLPQNAGGVTVWARF